MIALMLVACLSLQDDAAATAAVAEFDAVLAKSKDPNARIAAAHELAKTPHEKVASRLGAVLSHDEKELRIAAAQTLAKFKEPAEVRKTAAHALAGALSAGANLKEPEVQAAIFAAIGHLQEESSANVLKSHFDDRDVQMAVAAVGAAGDLKAKQLVEPMIDQLRDCEKKLQSPDASGGSSRAKPMKTAKGAGSGGGDPAADPEAQKRMRAQALQPALQGALAAITGQTFAASTDWEKWWSKNRATFTPSK
jgi:hypothetical protein